MSAQTTNTSQPQTLQASPQLTLELPQAAQPGREQWTAPKWKSSVRLASNASLARRLGWQTTQLLTLLSKNKSENYSSFSIRKRSGALRRIHSPSSVLRVAQYRILKGILDKVEVPDYIFAFEREKSIPAMAQYHVGKKCVVSIDLKDYFTSIKQHDVYFMLQQLGVADKPARTISELCTYGSYVPQGALTSPKISNIISSCTFGPILKQFCDHKGYSMTIYADDVTISSTSHMDIGEVISFVRDTVRSFRFKVNESKTKIMTSGRRQYVCGVVVNAKSNLPVEERRLLKNQIHSLKIRGVEETARLNEIEPERLVPHLQGRIGWFTQLNPTMGLKYQQRLNEAITMITKP